MSIGWHQRLNMHHSNLASNAALKCRAGDMAFEKNLEIKPSVAYRIIVNH